MVKPYIVVVTLFLSACGETVQTLEWYKENPEARKEMIKKCNSNPTELAETPNCINAQTAQARDSSWFKKSDDTGW
ncbi:EexN family lipoprotein [Spartinivicinus ruber]|uniref:EexN family lipoprotein n=1 Tax=Spartinivicinus ruber TaxID=2683272 RepID=UPI0013D3D9FD|nr:EexN family lipoprotein [Spartinivicinus ruber]